MCVGTGWSRNTQRHVKTKACCRTELTLFNAFRVEFFHILALSYRGKLDIKKDCGFSKWPSRWLKWSRFILSHSYGSLSPVGSIRLCNLEGKVPWLSATTLPRALHHHLCHSVTRLHPDPSLWSRPADMRHLLTAVPWKVSHFGAPDSLRRSITSSQEVIQSWFVFRSS